MKKVICSHKMKTTNFLVNDPDKISGQKMSIPLKEGAHCFIDIRIAKKYPSTFKIIRVVSKPEADSDELKPNPDDVTNETEKLDVEPVVDGVGFEFAPGPGPEVVSETEEPLSVDADPVDAEADPVDADQPVRDAEADPVIVNEPNAQDEEAPTSEEMIEEVNLRILSTISIDSFKNKKDLDEWAKESHGLELDGRKSLKNMKADAKAALNLV